MGSYSASQKEISPIETIVLVTNALFSVKKRRYKIKAHQTVKEPILCFILV